MIPNSELGIDGTKPQTLQAQFWIKFTNAYSPQINGTLAYAAQRAWIQNATLRDNVLFGMPMDAERYARVLSACALTSDLELLEAGDQTEIGEKG